MIPSNESNIDLTTDFDVATETTRTYRMDHNRKRITGYVDERQAIEQAIYKLLSTERYDEIVYSWNYGAEIGKLFGKPIPYVYSELKRLTTEALLHDERILSAEYFTFEHKRNKVFMSLVANTIYGFVEIQKEVGV